MFKKILIANRGEIACRIMRACHAVGAKAVVVYSEADAQASYLNDADETIGIGPGPAAQSYLNQEAIFEAAQKTECQAVHPGYGFLAENAIFAARAEQQKLTFIGPKPKHIRLMGDKDQARETMRDAGMPITPGSRILQSASEAMDFAKHVGYPVLLKATAGGGGRGMRVARNDQELIEKFAEASAEADKAFANAGLYLEKYIEKARHIEFQILGDSYGHIIHLGERECSIQRKHQKLLEEAPAPGIDAKLRAKVGDQIVHALKKIGYQNAGTIELMLDERGNIYFMEMNTRIQVEHPVTEMITGVDLVAWQIRIAAGERLTLNQNDIQLTGHAIECRINAEDPNNDFKPTPGEITGLSLPNSPFNKGGEGDLRVRVDTHVRKDTKIPPYYDSLLAKLITHANTREEAISLMQKALSDFKITGVPTTIGLHQKILQHKDFKAGNYTTKFLDQNPLLLAGEGDFASAKSGEGIPAHG